VDKQKVKIMTRNLYLGGDIFKMVDAAENNPASIPFVVAEVFHTMLQTNFQARAEAIADEITNASPQVIGLQEVSTFYIQTPDDFLEGNPNPAKDVVIDFYTVLNDALEARGMYYDYSSVINSDVERDDSIFMWVFQTSCTLVALYPTILCIGYVLEHS
jgi:hypothetical protein